MVLPGSWHDDMCNVDVRLYNDYTNVDLSVSKNRGTPQRIVYKGKPYKNWWFGGTPIFGNTHLIHQMNPEKET